MKIGDLATINKPSSKEYHGRTVKLTSGLVNYSVYNQGYHVKFEDNGYETTVDVKYLKPFEITITIEGASKPTWQDKSDSSRIDNVRPGIHAACYYTDDGSCWEWLITTKATGADIVKSGRSIDRRTAKSDAEFFIANYQPEDTSERDELRRKLEKSWSK